MRHWHLAYRENINLVSRDIDFSCPYWNEEQACHALNTHNAGCKCRHVTVKECNELMCIVRGLE
jgi:hypothetical protein